MMENCQVRFGGGPMEKWLNGQLASGLPYQGLPPQPGRGESAAIDGCGVVRMMCMSRGTLSAGGRDRPPHARK
jgi:hypothetical protein